jgi:type I restriction-modification system DNA methylase subunit
MVRLKGTTDIGDQINKRIIAPLAHANQLSDFPDFNDATKLGSGKKMVDRLTNLVAIFENPVLDFSKNRAEVTLYGQEKDAATSGRACMNMILHHNPTALVEQGNTLADPKFKGGDTLKTFDYVVANPPFSDKRWTTGFDLADDPYERFTPFGVPPAKQGDYAYLLHIVQALKSTGKGACILPHGVLFRGNAEPTSAALAYEHDL